MIYISCATLSTIVETGVQIEIDTYGFFDSIDTAHYGIQTVYQEMTSIE